VAVTIYANQPSTTVTSGGTGAPPAGTPETWTVTSSASFPAASSAATPATQFHVADKASGFTSEIVQVTNVSGTTWTVTRGAESSPTVAHAAGFAITQVVSAGDMGSLLPLPGGTMTGPLEVQGQAGSSSSALSVIADSDAGQGTYFEQDSSTDHCVTVNLAGTGGATQAALNVVSANSAFSAMELAGTETAHGTLKITHKGYASGSDSGAAAISIDQQTTVGGSTGTASQGLFITSTTDSIPGGDAIDVRYNGLDWFVVKGSVSAGQGIVGIGVATGHVPAGMLEIVQKDTTTFGLAMTALASGTDMINLKDSGGNQRFQVNNSGNLITRATYLNASNMQVGSASSNIGGGGNGVIGISQASTAPSANPTSNGVILYVDTSGNLLCRTSAGNVRTVAAV
jgi:Hyaluronidase protein (HylP)